MYENTGIQKLVAHLDTIFIKSFTGMGFGSFLSLKNSKIMKKAFHEYLIIFL